MPSDEKHPHTLYRPEYAEQAHNYCLLGATNLQLAEFFGVHPRTIDLWIMTRDDFNDAVKNGRAVADAKVAAACFKRAVGYTYTNQYINKKGELVVAETEMPPDVHAQVFWLTRRRRDLWAEKQEVLPDGGMLTPIGSAELVEVARRIAFILARATQGEIVNADTKEISNDKQT